ncbi:MAG TPA: DUF309 domain-containing protein [Candidatus Limnocylindrales bacterium]|jgi:hypothetical protein
MIRPEQVGGAPGRGGRERGVGRARGATVLQGGRAKAYRPISADARAAAQAAGLAAYERGEFFEAHELMEPAWMGTDDLAERELHQGLIKLAAAFVHADRGNRLGIQKNLRGAHLHLAAALAAPAPTPTEIDVATIVAAIEDRLARLAARPSDPAIAPIPISRLA